MPEVGKEPSREFENGSLAPLTDANNFFRSVTPSIQTNVSFSSNYTEQASTLFMCSEKHSSTNADNVTSTNHNLNTNYFSENHFPYKDQIRRPVTAPPAHVQREHLRTSSEPPYSSNNDFVYDNKKEKLLNVSSANSIDLVVNNSESEFIYSRLSPSNEPNITSLDVNNPVEPTVNSSTPILNHITTWHPHVYAMPPKAPTPHSIGDILGIKVPKKPMPIRPEQKASRATINQILNATLKRPVSCDSDYLMQYPRHQSRSHEHIDSIYDRTIRSSSLSEGSEDDSIINDQPLNLSITRSRDSSPVLKSYRQVKPKKGKRIICIFIMYLIIIGYCLFFI